MIPVCTPMIGAKEKQYVNDCLDSNWISSSGKYIKAFEESFSKYCGSDYGITTTNGTTALHLAMAAIGIKKGDEVIMPSFTIASVPFAVVYCGGKPVFVDSQADTWNIDPLRIEKKITKRTKAIVVVHVYGHPCDMDPIMKIAQKHKLIVVEDAAEAHGAEYKGRKVGGIGRVACFSFYANKIITTGEGGMVVTSDKKIAEQCRLLRNLSFIEPRFWHKELGFNHRMTNIQAAIGLAQFEQIDDLIERRRRNAHLYNSLLKNIPGITLPAERPGCKNVYWMYSILIGKEYGLKREALMGALKEKGIETRTFFISLHNQPIAKKMGYFTKERFLVSNDISKRGLYLPSGGDLKQSDIEYVCDCIKQLRGK